MSAKISVGIITVSDRAAAGEYADLGGPALRAEAGGYGWDVIAEAIVPAPGVFVVRMDLNREAFRCEKKLDQKRCGWR